MHDLIHAFKITLLSNVDTFILSFYVEQYDAFVKFNYDQVQKRFQETAPTCEYHNKKKIKKTQFIPTSG